MPYCNVLTVFDTAFLHLDIFKLQNLIEESSSMLSMYPIECISLFCVQAAMTKKGVSFVVVPSLCVFQSVIYYLVSCVGTLMKENTSSLDIKLSVQQFNRHFPWEKQKQNSAYMISINVSSVFIIIMGEQKVKFKSFCKSKSIVMSPKCCVRSGTRGQWPPIISALFQYTRGDFAFC